MHVLQDQMSHHNVNLLICCFLQTLENLQGCTTINVCVCIVVFEHVHPSRSCHGDNYYQEHLA